MKNTIGTVYRSEGPSIVNKCEYCGGDRCSIDYIQLFYPVPVHFYTKWLIYADKGQKYKYSGNKIEEFNGKLEDCFSMCICRKCSDAIATKWPVDVHMSIL